MFSLAKYAAARQRISFSISETRSLRRSSTSSTRSDEVTLSLRPSSTPALATRLPRPLSETPRSWARVAVGFAPLANSMARARNSGGRGSWHQGLLPEVLPPQCMRPSNRGKLSFAKSAGE